MLNNTNSDRIELDQLIEPDRPICYGVLKPGPFVEGGTPLVRIVDIEGNSLATDGLFRISPTLDKEFARSRLAGDELLLSIQGTVGRVAIFPRNFGSANISRTIARLSFVEPANAPFLKHWFLSREGQQAIDSAIVGTTRSSLNIGVLRKLLVPRFSSAEKVRICEVLDTLDTAIHETEAIIAKLKAVKQGLLHDLLTRGIDTNGELRPPQAEAPHLYKESSLGWIPKEWEVFALGDAADSLVDGPFGSNLKTAHYVENPGVRVVRLQNILAGEYDDSERAFISESHAASLSRNRVVGGDVLIASLGDANYPVGRSCSYPTELPDAVNKADCFRFRASSRCRNAFAMFYMNSAAARKQVRGYEQGVTMKRINLGNLRRIGIPLPSLFEQDLIIERLQAAQQQQIKVATLECHKLRSEKAGLMDDLLTGRVRVTPLLEEAAS